jgi:hypothetical protein
MAVERFEAYVKLSAEGVPAQSNFCFKVSIVNTVSFTFIYVHVYHKEKQSYLQRNIGHVIMTSQYFISYINTRLKKLRSFCAQNDLRPRKVEKAMETDHIKIDVRLRVCEDGSRIEIASELCSMVGFAFTF